MVILPDFKGRYHSTVFNEYFFCRHRKKGEPEGPDYFNMCILIGVLLFCPALLFPAFVTGFSQRFYSLGQRKQFRYFFFDFGNGLRSFYHHVRGRPHSPEKNDRYRFTQFVDLFRCGSFSPTFLPLILLSAAKGFLLSGATSVSMAYIAEEVSSRNKGKIMGLYIAGNALGGMAGRVISSWIGALYTWRIASVSIGLICALFAILFLLFSPRSTNFMPRKESFHTLIIANLQLITSKALIPFYLTGGLILGVFVSLYNYLGFYLTKAPFNFPEHYIHYIYLMYIFGIFGSIATAGLTRYFTHFKVLKAMFLVSAAGILLLYITDFRVVTLGLAVFTFNFFVVHVLCNRIVSDYNLSKRSVTISIYLLTYYLGSSLLGWGTGVILDTWGWQYFLGSLILILLINYGIVIGGIKRMRADLS